MFAVVRLKGKSNINQRVITTFKMLRLDAPNNCVLVPETKDFKGMLQMVKDYVTFGEIDKKTLTELLKKKLESNRGKNFDEKLMGPVFSVSSYEELAEALINGKLKLIQKASAVFRLTPPSKGFKHVKAQYPKGDSGYRGNAINTLIGKMM